ncbi:MarR family transcriptional regulator [Desulfurispirillum indicum]|uniref:Regulatory protein MarR n=1 Tax=Desulfurispirillum indicum (strain ATCC BAA-1389 / DSM 22839 / S5) TaxID=653733 RepID=E6W784_DESIS|nr:MarR family transcriptional regulator [Desulfurispirillum indicum]ADU66251.1 regulatory protein MarR [Desulfurispirillum indicum S5]UCZ55583.1 MarR family transcriptional regulator [Desulfurispirillum indicum]
MEPDFPMQFYWDLCAALREIKHADLEFLKKYDVGPAQFRIMRYTHGKRGGVNLKDIATLMEVSPSNASRLVDKLVQKGWIDRSISPISKREILLQLTPDGKKMLKRIAPEQRKNIGKLLNAKLSQHDLEQLHELLQKLLGGQQSQEEYAEECDRAI